MRYPKDDETAQEVIDLALTVGCDYHPAEYGPCAHCVEAAERVVDAGYVSPEEVAAREAAARREALMEAIERIESLAGDYTNGGQTLSWQGARHCVETALTEPERDEEGGR